MISSKGCDKFHVSKLFINNMVQHIDTRCKRVYLLDPIKGFHMNGCLVLNKSFQYTVVYVILRLKVTRSFCARSIWFDTNPM